MHHFKKLAVAVAFLTFIIAGVAATDPPAHKHKNLKVLPKDISDEDLDKVMDKFKASLGVKCNFCHVPSKDPNDHHMDFASDEKPEKNIARKMMKMSAKINKKYFSFNKDEQGNTVDAVTCMTCHRGNSHPETK